MKPLLLILTRWLHQIGLGIWIGGLLAIGAVVAPVAFRRAGLTPDQAGDVVGLSLARYNSLLYAAGVLLLLTELLEWALERRRDRAGQAVMLARLLCIAGMLGLAIYLGGSLAPQMFADRGAGNAARFEADHGRYGALTQAQVMLALLNALLTACLSVGRTDRVERVGSGHAEDADRPATASHRL